VGDAGRELRVQLAELLLELISVLLAELGGAVQIAGAGVGIACRSPRSLLDLADAGDAVLLGLPPRLEAVALLTQLGSSRRSWPGAPRDTASSSRASETRSICSCMTRRSISSISCGIESICIRCGPPPRRRGRIALSGRKRSAM